MMDHNLDDLIIDNPESNHHNRLKGVLTIVVLILIILVFAIIFTKTILEDSSTAKKELEQDQSVYHKSPDLLHQESKPKVEHKTEKPLIDKALTINANDLIEKQPIKQNNTTENSLEETNHNQEEVTEIPLKEETITPTQEHVTQTEEITETNTHTEVETKTEVVAQPSTSPSASTESGYYIQVGYFAKEPSREFIQTIKKHNFTYTMVPYGNKGSKKFLIGPYPDKSQAQKQLAKVRKTINRRAFIIKR
jgi:DedD protein